ncbi:MAG: MoxR family ATPase [Armatimonadetes bacterium]|nr:MoxR family ATPase [Armatimonadota bacterium]
MESVSLLAARVRENVERVIVGAGEAIELALVALLTEGHILIEDVPGTGKTMLAKALARSIGCAFRRIQCTPDLLPSDITGLYYFNQRAQEFDFRAGPIFAQIILADEINRATPRTQAALLEAMQEQQVTVEGTTYPLPRPFLVLATQNPVELQGTFPLPEAQLDRFLLRLTLGYPDADGEREILRRFGAGDPLAALAAVASAEDLLEARDRVRDVLVAPAVEGYIIDLARETRRHAEIELGLSPRGTLALQRTCQALAAVRGRTFVLPDDAKALAPAVIPHRLILSTHARLRERSAAEIIAEILRTVPAPVEQEAR